MPLWKNILDGSNMPLTTISHHKKKMQQLSNQNKIMKDEMIELEQKYEKKKQWNKIN